MPTRTPVRSSASPWIGTGEHGEQLQVEDFPTFVLWQLSNLAKSAVTRRYLERFDLSLPEWRLLALVDRFSPLPFGEISARSAMDKGQVSRTLQGLQRRSLVRIEPAPAGSRVGLMSAAPRIEIAIAPKGRALCRRILPVARKHQMRLLGRAHGPWSARRFTGLPRSC